MQVDMHYYGTYAMARAAGLKKEACEIIARSAEYVDDNAHSGHLEFADGARLDAVATAHHALDVANIDKADQRQIWVPFHFIPGNQGNLYGERLVCRKDSEVARKLVDHNLTMSDRPYALELLGITAHVYADTFSHYGFSGVSSQLNRVVNDTIKLENITDGSKTQKHLQNKAKSFFKKYGGERFLAAIQSKLAEDTSGALGHGAVLTYPDMPYLVWSVEYEHNDQREVRDNPATFLQGCEALHGMFTRFSKQRPDYADGLGKPFGQIRDAVAGILATQGDKGVRIAAWKKAAAAGSLFANGENIKAYDAQILHDEFAGLTKWTDSSVVPRKSIFKFFQAASHHRQFVLRELLPDAELLVA